VSLSRRSTLPESRNSGGVGGSAAVVGSPTLAMPDHRRAPPLTHALRPHSRFLRLLIPSASTQGLSNQTPRRRISPRRIHGHGSRLTTHVLSLNVIPLSLPNLPKLNPEQWIRRLNPKSTLNRRSRDRIILRLQLNLRLIYQRLRSGTQHRFTNDRCRWRRLLGRLLRRLGRAGFDRGFRRRRWNGSRGSGCSIRLGNGASRKGEHGYESGKVSLPGNHEIVRPSSTEKVFAAS